MAYLLFLGAQAVRSAIRGEYPPVEVGEPPATGVAFGGWRQGFLSNVTNPKVLIFYLAVLPQFLAPGTSIGWLLAFAWSHALLSLIYLLGLVDGTVLSILPHLTEADFAAGMETVRRALDGATGAVLLGVSARLAAEHT